MRFTASGGSGPGAMATVKAYLTPWATRRPQSQDARVRPSRSPEATVVADGWAYGPGCL